MGSIYVVSTGSIATGTSLKTLLELITASTDRLTLISWWVEFDGATASDTPIKVELVRASAGITGTSITPLKYTDYAPAAATTAKHTATAEGTPTDILEVHYVPPTAGLIIQYPLGREIQVPVSSFIRARVTAGVGVNAAVGMVWDE